MIRKSFREIDFIENLEDQVNTCDRIMDIPELEEVESSYYEIFGRRPGHYMTRDIMSILQTRIAKLSHDYVKSHMDAYIEYCDDCEMMGWLFDPETFTRFSEWLQDK